MKDETNKRTDITNTANESGGQDTSADSGNARESATHNLILDRGTESTGDQSTKGENGSTKVSAYRYRDDEEVKHLHTLEGRALTGTSSIMEVISKPLTWWAVGLALNVLGYQKAKERQHKIPGGVEAKPVGGGYYAIPTEYRLSKAREGLAILKQMDEKQYLALLDKAYKAHTEDMKKSAGKGIDRHKLCEEYIKAWMSGKELPHNPEIKSFTDWAEKYVERFLWSEMHCYSEKHWLGGITDAGFIDKQGKLSILDFKSSAEAYMTQYWQIAGYDLQITENGGYLANGTKVYTLDRPIDYYTVFPFGAKVPQPQYFYDPKSAKEVFLSILNIYRNTPR